MTNGRPFIFVFDSPFQAICGIEARSQLGLEAHDCHVILLCGASSTTLLQTQAVLHPYEWASISTINSTFRPLTLFSRYRKLKRILRRIGHVEGVLIGDYRNELMRHVALSTSTGQVIVVDDGTATHKIAHERKLLNAHHISRTSTIPIGWRAFLKRYGFSIQYGDISNVTFFTLFKLTANGADKVIPNEFGCLRNAARLMPRSEDAYFLGTHLVELKMMSSADFLKYLKAIKQHAAFEQMIYIPHRREHAEKVAWVTQELRIPARVLDLPIEFHVSHIGPIPQTVGSFYSTALDSLSLAFGRRINIYSFRIPERAFLSSTEREFATKVYSYHQSQSAIEMCPLD